MNRETKTKNITEAANHEINEIANRLYLSLKKAEAMKLQMDQEFDRIIYELLILRALLIGENINE